MSVCNICDIPKKIWTHFCLFLPIFSCQAQGPGPRSPKKGNSMICLNMVQQPPRLEVASGPFKHLGPGVQLRLWLWIAVLSLILWQFISINLEKFLIFLHNMEISAVCGGKIKYLIRLLQ